MLEIAMKKKAANKKTNLIYGSKCNLCKFNRQMQKITTQQQFA